MAKSVITSIIYKSCLIFIVCLHNSFMCTCICLHALHLHLGIFIHTEFQTHLWINKQVILVHSFFKHDFVLGVSGPHYYILYQGIMVLQYTFCKKLFQYLKLDLKSIMFEHIFLTESVSCFLP